MNIYINIYQVIDRQERMMGEQRKLIKHLKGKLESKMKTEMKEKEGNAVGRSVERDGRRSCVIMNSLESKAIKR